MERLPEAAVKELAQGIRAGAPGQGLMIRAESKKEEAIPIALTPWVFSPEVARYLHTLFRGIRRTVNRVLSHYFEDPRLQTILPLRESELEWLKSSCPGGIPRPQTVFERFDTNLGAHPERQLENFKVIEFNGVGVGCVHLMPAATDLLAQHLLPPLKELLPEVSLIPAADYRQLLLYELQSHAKAIERPTCRIGMIERRETVMGGCDEFARIGAFFESKGLESVTADPREVERRNGELWVKDRTVDLLYRDFQLEEVVSIKRHGGSVEGIESAFARNQVISTLFGEFDHKSLIELLSNPEYESYFSPLELRSARKRFPWTRLIEERKTVDPEGKEMDLIPFIRANRERLVLKPNRGYGGEGVVVGEAVPASVWEEALGGAAAHPKNWVVQEQVKIEQEPMRVLSSEGKIEAGPRYVTLGVTATPRGVAFVGRCSEGPVVNISQGGGLVPVFLCTKSS